MNGNMNYDMDNDNDIDSECWFLVQCVVLITITSGKKKNEDMTTIWLMSWWIPVMNGRSNMNHDMDMNDDKNIESGESGNHSMCVVVGSSDYVIVYDNDSVLECRLTTRQKKNEDIAYSVSQQNVYTFSH